MYRFIAIIQNYRNLPGMIPDKWILDSLISAAERLKNDDECNCWGFSDEDKLPPAGNRCGPAVAFETALKAIRCEGHRYRR